MNKLITTYEGGMPLTLDDLKYLQDSTLNGLLDTIYSMGGVGNTLDKTILYGLKLTDTTLTGGAVLKDKQIYKLDNDITVADTYPTNYEFYYKPSYDPNGAKVFKNSLVYNTYQLYNLGVDTSANIALLTDVVWHEPVSNFKGLGDSNFESLTLDSSLLLTSTDLQIRFLPENKVNIVGTLHLNRQDTDNNREIIGVLPEKYIPKNIVNIVKANENGGSPSDGSIISILINTEGTVVFRVASEITFGTYYMNDIYCL